MSYVVHTWPDPLPRSYDEAAALPARLSRLDGPAHPVLLELARRLTARHPDLGDDGDDDDAVWTDGPLAGNAQAGLMSLGVRSHAIDTVVPFIVSTARALGLAVLDEQAGTLHLPDGRTLGPAIRRGPAAAPAPAGDEPLTRAQVREAMRTALGPVLQAGGFHPASGDADFSLTQPAARFDLQIAVESRGIGCAVSVVVAVRLPGSQPDPLVAHTMPLGAEFCMHAHRVAEAAGVAWPGSTGSIGAETPVETPADVDGLAARWIRMLEAELLPRIRRCASLEGLTQELTTHPDAFTAQRVALLLAASAGRKDLQAVHDALLRVQSAPWHAETTELLAWLQAPRPGARDDTATHASLPDVLPLLLGGGPPLRADAQGRLLALPQQPVTRRFVGGLSVVCAAEAAGQLRPIRHDQAAAWGVPPQAVFDTALGNLQARAGQTLRRAEADGYTLLQLDGRLEASLMLLDALWDQELAARTPSGALVAVPRPGLLAFSDIAAPGALQALRAFVAREAAEGALALSGDLFYRRDRKWERLPPRR